MKRSWVLGTVVLTLACALLIAGCAQNGGDQKTGKYDLEDGTYSARTEPDEHDWYAVNEITIKDGKITEVKYDEINAKTEKVKGKDYSYPKAVEAQDTYEEQLVKTQDPDKVEVVSGATSTWERFKQTAKEALRISD